MLMLLLTACMVSPVLADSQQEDEPDELKALEVDFRAGIYHQAAAPAHARRVHLDENLGPRRKYESWTAHNWHLNGNALTDTPLFHGASYLELKLRRQLDEGLHLTASIVADHYGFSFGTYSRDWTAFYPRFLFDLCREVDLPAMLTGRSLGLAFRVGTFEEFRYYEGLSLYNLDCQGFCGHLQYGHLRYSHLHIGDLNVGLGLAIGDLVDNCVSLQGMPVFGRWRADLGLGIVDYLNAWEDRWIDSANLSLGLYPSDRSRVYAQLGHRSIDDDHDWRLGYACLLGLRHRFSSPGLTLDGCAEFRHYGGIFNYRLNSETEVHYRDDGDFDQDNFTGSQLYPLRHIERPFSQWAVFTEYHSRYVQGATLQVEMCRLFLSPFWFRLDLDINMIRPAEETAFTYLLYNLGLECRLGGGAHGSLTITNKAMNLDKHYPTFYMLETPVFQCAVRRELDW